MRVVWATCIYMYRYTIRTCSILSNVLEYGRKATRASVLNWLRKKSYLVVPTVIIIRNTLCWSYLFLCYETYDQFYPWFVLPSRSSAAHICGRSMDDNY